MIPLDINSTHLTEFVFNCILDIRIVFHKGFMVLIAD